MTEEKHRELVTQPATDRELLELAAKAINFPLRFNSLGLPDARDNWNPLEDDGDALRLAVRLSIIVGKYETYASAGAIGSDFDITVWDHKEPDPYAATRRAIVRAAAEIGKLEGRK